MKNKIILSTLVLTIVFTFFCACQKQDKLPEQVMLPTGLEESDIYVEKIENLPSDFIKGMDVSSVLAEEASGVKYYNEAGEEEDVFKILAGAGVNYARIRVWNNPFDKNGNGYGGGNCDINCVKELGTRASLYGMKSCIDFHYSDFWADPNKQMAPKEWAHYSFKDKLSAIGEYTESSLNELLDAGVDVGMVQIGNEINHGLAGVNDFDKELELLISAANAVRKVSKAKSADIKIVVHFTEIDSPDNILKIVSELERAGVDYDIFGVSYYCYWHGTMDNMTSLLNDIKSQYGKDTCVMETAYTYTDVDADKSANSISGEERLPEYPVSVQGQANCIRDVMAASAMADSLGVFYWEGCWVAASTDYASNQKLYEENGSGWASSYSKTYDPNDAGKYYGGCSWDNQALFDAQGKALPSLNVFKYVNYGAVGKGLEILSIPKVELDVQKGTECRLPDEVTAIYNDTSVKEPVKVTWDENDVTAIDENVSKTYSVKGITETGFPVNASVKVASLNYIKNHSFEDSDARMWITDSLTAETPTDIQNKAADAYEGSKALHWWSKAKQEFDTYQEIENIPSGKYRISAYAQGGDVGNDAEIYLFVRVSNAGNVLNEYISEPIKLSGWVNWQNPVIEGIEIADDDTVQAGMHVKCAAGGWGTFDLVELVME